MPRGIQSAGVNQKIFLRKYRWIFTLDKAGINGEPGTNQALAQLASRPSISLTGQEVMHVSEQFSYPTRATWEPIEIVVFDVANNSQIYQWVTQFFDPSSGDMKFFSEGIADAELSMLDGKGSSVERWQFSGVWPETVSFGSLDMASNEVIDLRMQLRYVRAQKM